MTIKKTVSSALPFIAGSYIKSWKMWELSKPYTEELLVKQRIKLLYAVPLPIQGFYTSKPIQSMVDFKNVKFRVYSTKTVRMAELMDPVLPIVLTVVLFGLLFILGLLYIFLGCFLDNYSMILLTMGIVQPILEAMGIDLIWFGIFLVITAEVAQLTPPVGFNLFVLQIFTGRDIFFVARAAIPFFCLLLVGVVLITIFPQLVLYLPDRVFS